MSELGRLLIVEDDRRFAQELETDGARLGLSVTCVHDSSTFEQVLDSWSPTMVVMDLVLPGTDGVELLRICARHSFAGHLILMSGGFELYLKMAQEIAANHNLNVIAALPKPFRPKQFSFLLMSLL